MKTAQQNISEQPAECWHVNNIDGTLIKIVCGERGYRTLTTMSPSPEEMMAREGFKTMTEFADHLNETDGVSKAQRAAMAWGSMFGWSHGLADVDRYEEDGTPKLTEEQKATRDKDHRIIKETFR